MKKLYYGLVGLAGMCVSASAMAQDNNFDFRPSNIAFRLGVALPLDTGLSDFGSPLIGLGIEYTLGSSLVGSSGATYLSLDYMTASTEFNHGVYPFCINQRFYLGNGANGRRTYAFVGVGGAVLDLRSANTVLAARGGVGADLGDALFFEATLLLTDKASGSSADSVGFYIGYRF